MGQAEAGRIMEPIATDQPSRSLVVHLILRTLILVTIYGSILFGIAGSFAWPQAWVFLTLTATISLSIGFWMANANPGLLAERLRPPIQRGQPVLDRILLVFGTLFWFLFFATMALDGSRWRSLPMPIAVQAIGAGLILLGALVIQRSFQANSFAAPIVKLQPERDQRLADTGPYAWVRHPMYAGLLLTLIGMPLLLEAVAGFAFVPAFILILVVRIRLEERVLRSGLAGYQAYATRVRYRLVPSVW